MGIGHQTKAIQRDWSLRSRHSHSVHIFSFHSSISPSFSLSLSTLFIKLKTDWIECGLATKGSLLLSQKTVQKFLLIWCRRVGSKIQRSVPYSHNKSIQFLIPTLQYTTQTNILLYSFCFKGFRYDRVVVKLKRVAQVCWREVAPLSLLLLCVCWKCWNTRTLSFVLYCLFFFLMSEEIKLRRSSRIPKPSEKLRESLSTVRKNLLWNCVVCLSSYRKRAANFRFFIQTNIALLWAYCRCCRCYWLLSSGRQKTRLIRRYDIIAIIGVMGGGCEFHFYRKRYIFCDRRSTEGDTTIHKKRINLDQDANTSLYQLCREWFFDNPEMFCLSHLVPVFSSECSFICLFVCNLLSSEDWSRFAHYYPL
jgi:hypothetical protein